jgi:hypothetical protein
MLMLVLAVDWHSAHGRVVLSQRWLRGRGHLVWQSRVALGRVGRNRVDGWSRLVAQLNAAWTHRHLHEMRTGIAGAAHAESNDADDDDEDGDERDDSTDDADNQSVVVAQRLLDLRLLRLDLSRLRDWNAPNDVGLLGRRAGQDPGRRLWRGRRKRRTVFLRLRRCGRRGLSRVTCQLIVADFN